MSTPITAQQALEWAKEDVEALFTPEHPESSSARNGGLAEAREILNRWIKRVEDARPKQAMRTERDIHRPSRKDADL